jgi:hypothetical protein
MMFDFGWATAMLHGETIDKDGNPIPWFTYLCVEYLKQLDLRDQNLIQVDFSGFGALMACTWGDIDFFCERGQIQ